MRPARRPVQPARLSTFIEAIQPTIRPGSPAEFIERTLRPVPGWLMIAAGLSLVAMAVLTPSWLDLSKARWDLQLMQIQADRLDQQRDRYAKFEQAIIQRDPVLLERLAYTQLRLQPAERQVIADALAANEAGMMPNPASGIDLPPGDIDRWLAVAPPVVGVDVPPYKQVNNRLTRLTGQPLPRAVLLGVGALSVFAGLWWGPPRTGRLGGQPAGQDGRFLRIRHAA
jgi:hypothetical protein